VGALLILEVGEEGAGGLLLVDAEVLQVVAGLIEDAADGDQVREGLEGLRGEEAGQPDEGPGAGAVADELLEGLDIVERAWHSPGREGKREHDEAQGHEPEKGHDDDDGRTRVGRWRRCARALDARQELARGRPAAPLPPPSAGPCRTGRTRWRLAHAVVALASAAPEAVPVDPRARRALWINVYDVLAAHGS